jgi:hypothetical protein
VFVDGSRLRIVDGGQVLLKHVPHDAAHEDAITLAAAGGHFEIVTGALGEQAPPAIYVETPAARIHAARTAIAFQHASADGLVVSVLEGIGPDAGAVVVENDAGSASIADVRHRITVSGSENAPLVDQVVTVDVSAAPQGSAASGVDAPEAGNVEVSAGGEEGAFPGDPIVVSGTPKIFDLAPDAAPLAAQPFSGILLQSSSLPLDPGHHTEEVMLQGEPSPAPPASTDGTAPKKLTGWEPLNRVWDISGSAAVSGEAPELPYEHKSPPIKPTEQNSMAGLAVSPEQKPSGALESFFNLPQGSLAPFSESPIGGSAIRTQLSLSAGTDCPSISSSTPTTDFLATISHWPSSAIVPSRCRTSRRRETTGQAAGVRSSSKFRRAQLT